MFEEGGDDLDAVGTGEDGLDGILRGVDAAAAGKRRFRVRRNDREPAQAQQEFRGVGKFQVRDDLQILDVEVGLIKTVEEHEPGGAALLEGQREVGHRRVEGGKLHGDGNIHGGDDGAHDVQHLDLDLVGVEFG